MGEVILSSSVKERIRLATENIQCVYGGLVELGNCAWITDLVGVSVRSTDDEYLAHHAKAWASGFRWPPEVGTRDLKRLQECGGDLDLLVERIHALHADGRLSYERIIGSLSFDNPEIGHLIELVGGIGVREFSDPSFRAISEPPKLRGIHMQVGNAIDKLSFEGWDSDRVIILPTEEVLKIEGVHFSPAHWAVKKGKQCGRLIWDGSDKSDGRNCLNSVYVRDSIREHYGVITNPDLDRIMEMILKVEDSTPEPERIKLVLGKGDVKSAFPQLNFKPSDCKLMACQLQNGLSMIFHTGHFGWSGTPFAFGVVTRAIRHELKNRLKGGSDIYVDDYFWVCLQEFLGENIRISTEVVENLLGPGSVAVDKLENGRQLDIIGWHFDLDLRSVSLTERAVHKLVYGFFSVDVKDKMSLKFLQKLASWTNLYSSILRHLRPYATALYAETVGMVNTNVSKTIGRTAQNAVMVWRVMLCMLAFKPEKFSRSFDSFRVVSPTVLLEYDASLMGFGLRLTRIDYLDKENFEKTQLLGLGSHMFEFDLKGDSSYQNTCEFLAVVVAFLVLGKMGYRDVTLLVIGDSRTSNHWCAAERYKGKSAHRAALIFTILATHFNLWVFDTEWICSSDNGEMDMLSRGGEIPRSMYEEQSQVLKFGHMREVMDLVEACNPLLPEMDWTDTVKLWKSVQSWLL